MVTSDDKRDEIAHRIDRLIDSALEGLFDHLDQLRDRHKMTDVQMLDRLRDWPDLRDSYEEWIRGGEDE